MPWRVYEKITCGDLFNVPNGLLRRWSKNKQKITELETKITTLNESVSRLQKSQFDNIWDILVLKRRYESKVYFTPASKGYAPVWTEAGNLLVTLTNISKYANGYKLTFQIGNPTLATFSNVKMKVAWNKAYEKDADYSEWSKNEKTTEVALDSALYPGKWNTIVVTISPAKEEETGSLEVTLNTSTIALSNYW